jgi:hypothetical protein
MRVYIGEKIVIPFKPEHHLKNTGILCKVMQIHTNTIYVSKLSDRTNKWNDTLNAIDKYFLEQHKEKIEEASNDTRSES